MKVVCLDEQRPSVCTLFELNIADFFEYDGKLFQKRYNINGTVAMAMNFSKDELMEIRQSAEVREVVLEKIEYSRCTHNESKINKEKDKQ